MRKPALLTFAAASVLAITTAGAGVVLLQDAPPLASAVLPDGTPLRLEGVTHGTQHRIARQKNWQRLLIPMGARASRSGPALTETTQTEALLLWVSSSPNELRGWTGRLMPLDPHGCWFGRGGWHTDRRGQYVRGGTLVYFPRRDPYLDVRLLDERSATPQATFRIPNPTPGPFPNWTPEALPASHRSGEEQVTLLAVEPGVSWDEIERDASRRGVRLDALAQHTAAVRAGSALMPGLSDYSWTRLRFQMTQRGRPATSWALSRLDLGDATGNSVPYQGWELISSRMAPDGTAWAAFPGGLCTAEAAWKLALRFRWSDEEDPRTADFLWGVPDVPVPAPGRIADFTRDHTRGDSVLSVDGIAGRGSGFRTGDTPPLLRKDDGVQVRVYLRGPLAEEGSVVLHAFSPSGQELPDLGSTTFAPGAQPQEGAQMYFPVEPLPGMQRMTLELACWTGRSFEFTVRP